MTSSILQTAARLLMPLLLLFAVFLLLRGHNQPGGGFVGGLVVAASFVLYSIAFGVDAARRALLVRPSRLLGIGLLVALVSGLPGVAVGHPFMTAMWTTVGAGSAAWRNTAGVRRRRVSRGDWRRLDHRVHVGRGGSD
jgi:multicomponent Na+:H+ antiporter subunit B